eukprot:8658882-Ditylum_brightwellii.AAC.1
MKVTDLGPFILSTTESECIMDHSTQVEENPSTFLEYISTLPVHVQCFMGNLQQQEIDLNYWQAALRCRDVHIATDGSVAQKRGYYAVVLHTDDKVLKFQGPCDGSPLLMTSFYIELSGILATLYFINALQDYTNKNFSAQLPLYCNNMAAVLITKKSTPPGITSHLCPDFD